MITSIIKQTKTQDLSAGSLSSRMVADKDMIFNAAFMKASTNLTETVTVYFDSVDGATFDVQLDTSVLGGSADEYFYQPTGGILYLKKGDAIRIEVTNANTTGIANTTLFGARAQ